MARRNKGCVHRLVYRMYTVGPDKGKWTLIHELTPSMYARMGSYYTLNDSPLVKYQVRKVEH